MPEVIDQAIRVAKVVLVVIGPGWLDVLNQRRFGASGGFCTQGSGYSGAEKGGKRCGASAVTHGDAKRPDKKNLLSPDYVMRLGNLFKYHTQTFPLSPSDWNIQFERLRCRLASS